MYNWKVVPICERQLRDVQPKDLVQEGLYRLCDVYKSGGGYDKLPIIIEDRFGLEQQGYKKQFVVQLQGCCFRCPYCYVTTDGVNGEAVEVPTDKLVDDFMQAGVKVFHLMGGAPFLYAEHWKELILEIQKRDPSVVFHSDLLLYECEYTDELLESIAMDKCVYAVSIKGYSAENYVENTGIRVFNNERFKRNLEVLKRSKLNYYMTFTGMDGRKIDKFIEDYSITQDMLKDSFAIKLVEYDALK